MNALRKRLIDDVVQAPPVTERVLAKPTLPGDYLTLEQLTKMSGVSHLTILNWRRTKGFLDPVRRDGARKYWKRVQVEQWATYGQAMSGRPVWAESAPGGGSIAPVPVTPAPTPHVVAQTTEAGDS